MKEKAAKSKLSIVPEERDLPMASPRKTAMAADSVMQVLARCARASPLGLPTRKAVHKARK